MSNKFSNRIKDIEGNAVRKIFSLLTRPEIISFAGGFPTKSTLPIRTIESLASKVLSSKNAHDVLQYGPSEGYLPLKKVLLDFAGKYKGINNIGLDNILVISGGQQGIDFMCKNFINPGDTVLVEDPTYLAALQIIKVYEGVAVGVKASSNGLDVKDLEEKIIKYNPKFLYCVPTFSNPSGQTYSLENRIKIIEIINKHDVLVLEDDPYSMINYTGENIPTLKSLDTKDLVVYITSFSKIIAPSLRCGALIAGKTLVEKFVVAKQTTDVQTSTLSQAIVCEFLKENILENHLGYIIPIYKEKKNKMMAAIKRYMPQGFRVIEPNGGLFIWGEFDKELNINTREHFENLIKRDVVYLPGDDFYANHSVSNTMRLNFSNASLEEIEMGIKVIGNYFHELLNLRGGAI